MKLSLLIVAILGVAAASAVPTGRDLTRDTRGLAEDWADFYALVDGEKMMGIVIQYLAEDAEVQALVEYVLSDDFRELVEAVNKIPEYILFLNYLDAGGLDIWKWVGIANELVGATPPSPGRLASARITGGIAGLWADLIATLPLDKLYALFEEKKQTSPEFAHLIEVLTSPEAQTVYDALKANPEYQKIRAALTEYGLDIDNIISVIKGLIGWQ